MVRTVGSNALQRMRVSAVCRRGTWMIAVPAGQCELDDLAGAAASARREAVPHRDQHVAMSDRRPAGHDIGVEPAGRIAGQFEQAAGALDQRIEPLARAVVGEARAIGGALKRKDRLQFPAELQRDLRGNLIGAVGDWRNEAQAWRRIRKAVALLVCKSRARRSISLSTSRMRARKSRRAVLRQHVGAMTGHAYAQDKGDAAGGGPPRAEIPTRISSPSSIGCQVSATSRQLPRPGA